MVRGILSEIAMSNLYITEYSEVPNPLVNKSRYAAKQKIVFTTNTASVAFAAGTRCIRVFGDAAFHLDFGAAPVATANFPRFAANTEYFIQVNPAEKVGVYDGSS
jgi:hypothetical protein